MMHTADTKQNTDSMITLPADWYHSPEIYEAERKNIFAKEWLLFGPEQAVKSPGDFIANTIAGWSIFVIRSKEGELKAFHNVCRHRAANIVSDGTGKTMVLRCRYHGWVYDTDGNLRKAPDFGGDEKDLCTRTSLFPVHVKTWKGLVFICMNDNPPDFKESLGSLSDALNELDFTKYEFHSTAKHEIKCNWKTYVENYMEGYHIPTIHPELNKEVDMATYHVHPENRIARHICNPPQEAANDAVNDGLWLWLWPYASLNTYKSGLNLELMLPTEPESVELRYYYLINMDNDKDGKFDKTISMSHEVTLEDIEICEAVQKNLKSGIYKTGELSPRHEQGIKYFQDLVREAVKI
jgi:choline monooxygenase